MHVQLLIKERQKCYEKDLTAETLIRDIDEILLDAQTLQNMKLAAKQLGIPDAANKLYEVMNKLVKK